MPVETHLESEPSTRTNAVELGIAVFFGAAVSWLAVDAPGHPLGLDVEVFPHFSQFSTDEFLSNMVRVTLVFGASLAAACLFSRRFVVIRIAAFLGTSWTMFSVSGQCFSLFLGMVMLAALRISEHRPRGSVQVLTAALAVVLAFVLGTYSPVIAIALLILLLLVGGVALRVRTALAFSVGVSLLLQFRVRDLFLSVIELPEYHPTRLALGWVPPNFHRESLTLCILGSGLVSIIMCRIPVATRSAVSLTFAVFLFSCSKHLQPLLPLAFAWVIIRTDAIQIHQTSLREVDNQIAANWWSGHLDTLSRRLGLVIPSLIATLVCFTLYKDSARHKSQKHTLQNVKSEAIMKLFPICGEDCKSTFVDLWLRDEVADRLQDSSSVPIVLGSNAPGDSRYLNNYLKLIRLDTGWQDLLSAASKTSLLLRVDTPLESYLQSSRNWETKGETSIHEIVADGRPLRIGFRFYQAKPLTPESPGS